HARDDQHHNDGKAVEVESVIRLQPAGADPMRDHFGVRPCADGQELRDCPQRQGKSRAAEPPGHGSDRLPRKALSEEAVDGSADQRQHRNQPEMQIRRHSLSRFTWSTFKVSRVRYTEIMMASPTAASAAATTITKKTNTCPWSACHCAAKATKERFTPLSINSIDIKMVMILRLIRNPVTPQANRMPLRIR